MANLRFKEFHMMMKLLKLTGYKVPVLIELPKTHSNHAHGLPNLLHQNTILGVGLGKIQQLKRGNSKSMSNYRGIQLSTMTRNLFTQQ